MENMKALAVAGLCSLPTLSTPLAAETLKMATIAPEKSVWFRQIVGFVDEVNAAGTDLTIEVFGNAQLGNMADTFKNTLSGRLDIWVGVMPVMAAVTPELGTFSLPYMFESADEAKCVVPQMTDAVRAAIGPKYHMLQIT